MATRFRKKMFFMASIKYTKHKISFVSESFADADAVAQLAGPGHVPTENFSGAQHEFRDLNPRLYICHCLSFKVPSLVFPLSVAIVTAP